ncbi:hypothetical protein [Nocardia terpenica]|uniref:DUF320 domain-containing protein n=1 Tax=Nocardia terpenica TaxID=455432 RepID=A0A6G9ZDN1_9NOCA|nr:hypothetical protein [Nocardia terpenica]QIS23554.1 hypothetical protein F6W96_40010 [Nocardia terpenica]
MRIFAPIAAAAIALAPVPAVLTAAPAQADTCTGVALSSASGTQCVNVASGPGTTVAVSETTTVTNNMLVPIKLQTNCDATADGIVNPGASQVVNADVPAVCALTVSRM